MGTQKPTAPNTPTEHPEGGVNIKALHDLPGMASVMEKFVKGGFEAFNGTDLVNGHDINQYKDANGKITCPASPEERAAMKGKVIGG